MGGWCINPPCSRGNTHASVENVGSLGPRAFSRGRTRRCPARSHRGDGSLAVIVPRSIWWVSSLQTIQREILPTSTFTNIIPFLASVSDVHYLPVGTLHLPCAEPKPS